MNTPSAQNFSDLFFLSQLNRHFSRDGLFEKDLDTKPKARLKKKNEPLEFFFFCSEMNQFFFFLILIRFLFLLASIRKLGFYIFFCC